MNKTYNLPDKAFDEIIHNIKSTRRKVRFTNETTDINKIRKGWNFETKWRKKTIQRAADFITSLEADEALTFWQSIGMGPNANHNIAKLHVAVSSDGVLVKDHLIKILTKD
jgi:hypothetical protein